MGVGRLEAAGSEVGESDGGDEGKSGLLKPAGRSRLDLGPGLGGGLGSGARGGLLRLASSKTGASRYEPI